MPSSPRGHPGGLPRPIVARGHPAGLPRPVSSRGGVWGSPQTPQQPLCPLQAAHPYPKALGQGAPSWCRCGMENTKRRGRTTPGGCRGEDNSCKSPGGRRGGVGCPGGDLPGPGGFAFWVRSSMPGSGSSDTRSLPALHILVGAGAEVAHGHQGSLARDRVILGPPSTLRGGGTPCTRLPGFFPLTPSKTALKKWSSQGRGWQVYL